MDGGLDARLCEAASRGDVDGVLSLLDGGADVQARGNLPLFRALCRGHLDAARLLLARGAVLHAPNPLRLLTPRERRHNTSLLYGNPLAIDCLSDYALRNAAQYGYVDVARFLLARGVDCRVGSSEALKGAARTGHLAIVRLLLEHGADVGANGGEPFLLAAANGHAAVVHLFMQRAEAVCRQWAGRALFAAAQNGHCKTVRLLLRRGVHHQHAASSALEAAAGKGYTKTARALLDCGGGADALAGVDKALQLAAKCGKVGAVRLLLQRGADVHADDDAAMRRAAEYGIGTVRLWSSPFNESRAPRVAEASAAVFTAVLRLVVSDDSAAATAKTEALWSAVLCGQVNGARVLLDRGADATLVYPLRLALWSSLCVDTTRLLLAHGASVKSLREIIAGVESLREIVAPERMRWSSREMQIVIAEAEIALVERAFGHCAKGALRCIARHLGRELRGE